MPAAPCSVVSEELDELFEVSDRLMVMAQGRLSPSLPRGRSHHRTDWRLDERPVGCAPLRRRNEEGAHVQA